MDYNFLRDYSLVGMEFYHFEEYNESGVVYKIIDMDEKYIDIEWVDPEDHETEHSSLSLDDFIHNLNTGFYFLVQEDKNMSFLDQIW